MRAREIRYGIDFAAGRRPATASARSRRPEPGDSVIARIARLMALAIRFEGMLRNGAVRDYAELARLGGVTRARVTQIMKLLNLAPDIQERLLFLTPVKRLTEHNLRPVVNRIDWDEQRELLAGMAVFHHPGKR